MPRTATIALREHVGDEVLLRIARVMARATLGQPPGFLDGADSAGEEDDDLFGDHSIRSPERGYYAYAEEECRSRRVDLRGPTDLDPGPLEMGPAQGPPARGAIVLNLKRPRS